MTDCLDFWATLGWLEGEEPAASRVEQSLETRLVMSWINSARSSTWSIVRRGPTGWEKSFLRHHLHLDLPTEARVLEAASIKAKHALAYADAFAIATAMAHDASLLTGDPEILDGGDPAWRVIDLRP